MALKKQKTHRKHKYLAIVLMLLFTICITGCNITQEDTMAARDKAMVAIKSIPSKIAQITKNVGDAIEDLDKRITNRIRQWNSPPEPRTPVYADELADLPADVGPKDHYCEPYDGEPMDVFFSYNELDTLGSEEVYFACVGVYTTNFPGIQEELKSEFVRVYGYEPYSYMHHELVGQYYIDGEDWVPVYKVTYRDNTKAVNTDPLDTVLVHLDPEKDYASAYYMLRYEGDGWEFREDLIESGEYFRIIEELQKKLCEITGMTPEEIQAEPENSYNAHFIFMSNLRELDTNEPYCIMSIVCGTNGYLKYAEDTAEQ